MFGKRQIHAAEDEIKDLKSILSHKIPIIPVIEESKFHIIESFYNLNVTDILFDFKPDNLLEAAKSLITETQENSSKESAPIANDYRINFYDNKGAFIIDISGTIIKEKVIPLKLMFDNILKPKIHNLKVIIYVFSNTNEKSMTFQNIWALLSIWKELDIGYTKIAYLSNSQLVKDRITKLFKPFGMQNYTNLLDIIKKYYHELEKKSEEELFEFSSQLLQPPNNKKNG